MTKQKELSFGDYQEDGHLWITLSTGEYYPDVLPLACELYKPVLVTFGHLLESSHSSTDLFLAIAGTMPQWMRIQLCRVFRKYVSPETPVEMLKKKSAAQSICDKPRNTSRNRVVPFDNLLIFRIFLSSICHLRGQRTGLLRKLIDS